MSTVAAIVLAAGRGTRMEGANKLASKLDGVPVLRRTAAAVLASGLRPVVVVTGHDAEQVRDVLDGLDVRLVHNPDYERGLSTSIATGVRALPEEASGAAILLGDMPLVGPALLDRLASALDPEARREIVVPMREGQRGNPVVWARRFFPDLMALRGDTGARALLVAYRDAVVEVEVPDDAAFTDIDTRDELERLELHLIAERFTGDASSALDGMRSEDA